MTTGTLPPPSIAQLLAEPSTQCDKRWLRRCLQVAVQLELSTIPPYLYAYFSVEDPAAELADALLGIAWQEMLHLGLACNLLVAAGGKPQLTGSIAGVPVTPRYPTALPGGVQPGLVVPLQGVSATVEDPEDVLRVFMDIEEPEHKLTPHAQGATIGQFYARIAKELPRIAEAEGFGGGYQYTEAIGGDVLAAVESAADGVAAIQLICEQGEGSSQSPNSGTDPAELAHYYRLAEHWKGRRLVRRAGETTWDFLGEAIPRPAVHPLAAVPRGGWPSPPEHLVEALVDCNNAYRAVLSLLEEQWGGAAGVSPPDVRVDEMRQLTVAVRRLLELQPTPVYGPEFLA
ncbi:ferritin-like domain-containing protein [Streptomyces rimosus]|uniref:ferritin-like domain-containing protein n=1 Tax=Streptomyces rimosus TaxID=1927 RepID=UPI0006B2923B|nr:ferritin-like protein [Streptomyces rimosus]